MFREPMRYALLNPDEINGIFASKMSAALVPNAFVKFKTK